MRCAAIVRSCPAHAANIQVPIATRKETTAISPKQELPDQIGIEFADIARRGKPAEGAAAQASPHGPAMASRQTRACTGIEFFVLPAGSCQPLPTRGLRAECLA